VSAGFKKPVTLASVTSEVRGLMAVVEARLNAESDESEQWVKISKLLEQAARKARKFSVGGVS
jgi:hypothetical protein